MNFDLKIEIPKRSGSRKLLLKNNTFSQNDLSLNPLLLSASQIVSAIHDGILSAEHCLNVLLQHVKKQAHLNAFISVNETQALQQAREIDALRKKGKALPALAGLPIVVKDNINSCDLPTTSGTPALENFYPNANAPVLQKLLDAGAIILGKTNLHELAFGVTSCNASKFAGAVKNPYNPELISGGSSGGTAVAIAVGITPVGLGTDTGGSCRIPAALCGIAGFRPSVGNGGNARRYDAKGICPISTTRDTAGILGKSVADIILLDSIIAADWPDPNVPEIYPLKGLRVGIPTIFWEGLAPSLASVAMFAKQKLAEQGVIFIELDIRQLIALEEAMSFPIALHEPLMAISSYLDESGASDLDNPIYWDDLVAKIASPDVKQIFEIIVKQPFKENYQNLICVLRPQLQALYGQLFKTHDLDVWLFPTTPLPAIHIDPANRASNGFMNLKEEADVFKTYVAHTGLSTNIGSPALSVPAGMTVSGLPVGLEINGTIGSDRKILSIGLALENVLKPLMLRPHHCR